ncbi:hypothetical protein T05_15874 [Trichinella murrelli]|uniref:Uncharacterized protein n=1 Tax=Trichinella murrelli TaxID=144512 RepID=A0A0V0TY75_9BILA|nr:hypothetical protein T05_15874 [Trichinella murrelli]
MIMQAAAAVSQSVKRSRSDEQIVAGKQNQVIGVLIVVVIEKMKRTNSSSSSNNNNNKWLQSIPTFYMHTLRLGKSRAEEKGTIVGQSRPNTDGQASTELSTKELKNAPTFPPDTGYGHERSSFRKRGTFPQAIVDYITAQDNNTIQYNTIQYNITYHFLYMSFKLLSIGGRYFSMHATSPPPLIDQPLLNFNLHNYG